MSEITKDTWKLGEHEFSSRFILGSGKYSLELIDAAVKEAKAEIVTMALRRANEGGVANILDYIPKNVTLLPNTSGARNAEEAVRIARLSRQISGSDFVKIEVIHDSKYLLPDNYETAKAVEVLAKERYGSMRSTCRSSWMPVSESRHRHVKSWRWELLQSWQIPQSRRLVISRRWQLLSVKRSKPEERHTSQAVDVSKWEGQAHPRR